MCVYIYIYIHTHVYARIGWSRGPPLGALPARLERARLDLGRPLRHERACMRTHGNWSVAIGRSPLL